MPVPQPLDRGNNPVGSLAAAATDSTVVDCGGASTLLVKVAQGAGASGDITVTILPYQSDNATIMPGIGIPAVFSSGPTLTSAVTYFIAQYDVTCLDKVRFDVKNNNAGAQAVSEKSWRLA